MSFSFGFLSTASRMRACACDTVSRLGVRGVRCWSAFLSAPPLPSTDSAATEVALFTGFAGTTSGSDFSRSCIIGYSFISLPDADRSVA